MGYKLTAAGKFVCSEPCKNPAWLMLKFIIPEIYKGSEVVPPEPNCQSLIPATESGRFNLVPGAHYNLNLDVSVEQSRNGYPARTQFKVLGYSERK